MRPSRNVPTPTTPRTSSTTYGTPEIGAKIPRSVLQRSTSADAGHERPGDLEQRHVGRRRDQPGTPPLGVAAPRRQAEHPDDHEHHDPAGGGLRFALAILLMTLSLIGIVPPLPRMRSIDALPEEQAGEGDDERRQAEPRDDRALEQPDPGACEQRGAIAAHHGQPWAGRPGRP